jgi:hypothetical protein
MLEQCFSLTKWHVLCCITAPWLCFLLWLPPALSFTYLLAHPPNTACVNTQARAARSPSTEYVQAITSYQLARLVGAGRAPGFRLQCRTLMVLHQT